MKIQQLDGLMIGNPIPGITIGRYDTVNGCICIVPDEDGDVLLDNDVESGVSIMKFFNKESGEWES